MDVNQKPLPRPTPETQPFWDAAKRHELSVPYCSACDKYIFYPRSLCPDCWSTDLQWRTLSGLGSIYSYTVAEIPSHPAFVEDLPYVIAIVELEEGPRMTTTILNCEPTEVSIGMEVKVAFQDVTPETTLVAFSPV